MRDLYPEEATLVRRLYEDHTILSQQARCLLEADGVDAPSFVAANKQVDALWRQIRAIIGSPGVHVT